MMTAKRPLFSTSGIGATYTNDGAQIKQLLQNYKLMDYPSILKGILSKHVELCRRQPLPDVDTFLVTDEANGHYIWMNVGWQNGERVSGMTVYVRLREGKFWIEEDWTEEGIATYLVREGVPKEDIVLAFHDPETRKHTEFAAA